MKPAEFDYTAPVTVEEALDALAARPDEARVLAGGQSLVALMNLRLAMPSLVVDINRVEGLEGIVERDGGVVIGATARQADVERSDVVTSRCRLLVDALRWVSHPQLRNRGTVVGSLVHHDPAAELPAVAVALDAKLTLRSPGGTRVVDAKDFFLTHYTTDVAPGEMVTEVWFPALEAGTGTSFTEIARRRGDFALVGVAVALRAQEGEVTGARVAMCAMADRPVRCRAVEEALVGAPSEPATFATAAAAVDDEAALSPSDDIHASAHYRRSVASVLVERALTHAAVHAN